MLDGSASVRLVEGVCFIVFFAGPAFYSKVMLAVLLTPLICCACAVFTSSN